MLFDKQQIVSMISDPQQRQQAAQQLPDQVDHQQHADQLQQFGIDPNQLAAAGGAQGQSQGGFNDPSQGGQGGFNDPSQGFDPQQGQGGYGQQQGQGGFDQGTGGGQDYQ